MKHKSAPKIVIFLFIAFALVVWFSIKARLHQESLCIEPGCQFKKEEGKLYCLHHGCREQDCLERAVTGRAYCEIHLKDHPPISYQYTSSSTISYECRKDGCTSYKAYGSVYCDKHTCHEDGCYNGTKSGSLYCAQHALLHPGKSSSSKSNSYRSSSSYSDSSPENADDLDVEGLYEDYPDEFEDVDDAWDYLEDNPDEWDDY